MRGRGAAFAIALGIAACQPGYRFDPATDYVIVGVHVWDGTGTPPSELAVVQISQGRILSIDPIFDGADVSAEAVDTASVLVNILTESAKAGIPGTMRIGQYVIPGLINTHGHVGGTWNPGTGVEYGDYAAAELARYARFGVTTVASLGGDREASFALRDASWGEASEEGAGGSDEDGARSPARARLLVAGPVVTGSTPEEAAAAVDGVAAMGPDWIKIRVDDNLGATRKMSPETYQAVISRAREHGLPVASHLFSTRRTPRDCCGPEPAWSRTASATRRSTTRRLVSSARPACATCRHSPARCPHSLMETVRTSLTTRSSCRMSILRRSRR